MTIPNTWGLAGYCTRGRSVGPGRARERIVRLCESLIDARTLRLELLGELRQMVPFDAYAWLLTDPRDLGRLITARRRPFFFFFFFFF